MEKHTKKWFSIVFCMVLVSAMAFCLVKPAESFSESENRALVQMPTLSTEGIMSGEFTQELEEYSTDQFPMRSLIVSLKAHIEKITGKRESGGVYFSSDGYLIEKPDTYELKIASSSLNSIKKLDALGRYNVSAMLVPTAYEILSDKLPPHTYSPVLQRASQLAEQTFADTAVNFIDPTQTLRQHADEYIYFRTDHHQTAYGSFLAYTYLCEQLGITPYKESDFTKTDLSDEFLGTMWSKAPLFDAKSDTISIYKPNFDISYNVNYVFENKTSDSFYEMSWLDKKDKYSVFFDGNHPIITINTSNKNGKTLAVFKDSYANSILPLLANHYETLHVIDLRYYSMNPLSYLDENNVSDVLVLYNTANFITDTNPAKLSAFIK